MCAIGRPRRRPKLELLGTSERQVSVETRSINSPSFCVWYTIETFAKWHSSSMLSMRAKKEGDNNRDTLGALAKIRVVKVSTFFLLDAVMKTNVF